MGESTTPGCLAGSSGAGLDSAIACTIGGALRATTGAGAGAALRATRTRMPSCSISISVRPVSSRSLVSSWISSRSTIVFGDFAIAGHSTFLLGVEQTGKAGNCQRVAVNAEPGDHRLCRFRYVRILPEALARVDIGDVHLD